MKFDLLRFLLERAQEICSREVLTRAVLRRPFEPLDRSLDMHVLRLRKKLHEAHGFEGGIRTVRNGGYMLTLRQGSKTQPTHPPFEKVGFVRNSYQLLQSESLRLTSLTACSAPQRAVFASVFSSDFS